jgi:hypothetical protein
MIAQKNELRSDSLAVGKSRLKKHALSRAMKDLEPASKWNVRQIERSVMASHRQLVQPEKTVKIVVFRTHHFLCGAAIDETS